MFNSIAGSLISSMTVINIFNDKTWKGTMARSEKKTEKILMAFKHCSYNVNTILGSDFIPHRSSCCDVKSCLKSQRDNSSYCYALHTWWSSSELFRMVGPNEERVN